MRYKSEKDMYPDICQWLDSFLNERYKKAHIEVYELSQIPISRFLRTYNHGNFPAEWVTWNIKVDIVGFVHHSNNLTDLIFVECKNTNLTLSHLSQLIGYSRIAQPISSFLISSTGFSPTLISLLQEYHRRDVLEYHWEQGKLPRQVVVAQWDRTKLSLNRNTIIGGIGL